MLYSMPRYLSSILLLVFSPLLGTVDAAQICLSQSEIPASTPRVRFTIQDNTVTDNETGLMWAKCAAGLSGSDCTTGSATMHNWQEALDLASASNLAGYGDWRLPNINELRSIVEGQCSGPSINLLVFPNTPTPTGFFWSSSPAVSASGHVFTIAFTYGQQIYSSRYSDIVHVRLVRGGD